MFGSLFTFALGLVPALAAPSLVSRSVTTLSTSAIDAFTPYTQLARAAYCSSSSVANWACGPACQGVPGVQISVTGGDDDAVPLFYIGYWPANNAVVVGHEGTDPTQLLSLATDADAFLASLDSSLFPGAPSTLSAHNGFLNAHAASAPTVISTVNSLIASKGAKQVVLVGHSLGGAIAELDALMLRLQLPSSIAIKAVTFGTPRVGNPAYAAFFDSKVSDFTRINHASDLIPIVPGRGLGYLHPSGEVHYLASGGAVACPGEDDATDAQCQIQTVPNILVGNIADHLGPYQGLFMGTVLGDCL